MGDGMSNAFKEVKKLLKFATDSGFVLQRHTKHLILKKGPDMVTVSGSPSDPYSTLNAKRHILRILKKQSLTSEVQVCSNKN